MKFKEPKCFMLASTRVSDTRIDDMLEEIGVEPGTWETNARTGAEKLIEVCGRLCYKAFGTELNPNITKVREGNDVYIKNLLDTGHGSVLEHGTVTFAFINITRVFTHEEVRHRVGTAFSQESLRYMRLTELGAYFPEIFSDEGDEERYHATRNMFQDVFQYAEAVQKELADLWDIDEEKDFNYKKKLTSAFRRLAPIGLTTNIVVTANHRAWRHIIAMRCSEHAEEEICRATYDAARQLKMTYKNIYQDMTLHGDGTVTFVNEKV